jgi:Na+/H+-dicarboxylate symporter
MSEALVTAFSTASSAATLPITTRDVIQNNVNERTATFVLPVGSTVNMNGTALYEGVAVIFIAQALGIPLGIQDILVVLVLATLAAMAAAAVPEAGLVTMVIILQALNLPLDAIGMLLAVDWLLDRCRTTVNVWGDSVGAVILDRYNRPPPVLKFEAI